MDVNTKIIKDKLRKIEERNNVTILYAVESGSRAWGHPNTNSDYDVRFIYKHNDLKHYLTINQQPDVIESMDELYDIVGWDIKKALLLHYKSNPNLREWIFSPIKYIPMNEDIFAKLPEFDPEVLKHHYYGLTKRHYRKYIKNNEDVNLKLYKKLLYVVRCILAYMLLDENQMPPMNLDDLIKQSRLDKSLEDKIFMLIDAYSSMDIEKMGDNDVYFIIEWIVFSLEYMEETRGDKKIIKNIDEYNQRFQEIVFCDES